MTTYTAVAHVHSDWSYDGRWTLEDLARAFAKRRCAVVLMSEHDIGFDEKRWADYQAACAAAGNNTVLLVPGMEYSDKENRVHVLVWGNLPFLGEGCSTGDLLEQVAHHGGSAFLAHPTRRDAWRDPTWAGRLTGVEIWNRKYDGVAPSREALALARAHADLTRLYGLDFHTRRQFFPLRQRLDVDGPLTVQSVYDALSGGRFSRRALSARPAVFETGVGLAAGRNAEYARHRLARMLRARAARKSRTR